MARTQHHRGKKSVMPKCADFVFLYESTRCDSFVTGLPVCVGVCGWVVVWDVCLLRRLLTVYKMRHLIACFDPLLISSFFLPPFHLHHLSSLSFPSIIPLSSFPTPVICLLSFSVDYVLHSLPRTLLSNSSHYSANSHPHPARRCVNMASRSLLTCVAPSGTASSLC